MEIGGIWGAPTSQKLIGEHLLVGHSAEEIHSPLCTIGLTIIDVEEAERNIDRRHPRFFGLVQNGLSSQAINGGVGDEEMVEGSTGGAHFGRVVYKGLVGDVVGGHLKLEVGLRVLGAVVDERLHDFVFVDGVIVLQAGVVVEVLLVERGEDDVDGFVRVAEIYLGLWERSLIGHGFVVVDGSDVGARWDFERRDTEGQDRRDEDRGGRGDGSETHFGLFRQ